MKLIKNIEEMTLIPAQPSYEIRMTPAHINGQGDVEFNCRWHTCKDFVAEFFLRQGLTKEEEAKYKKDVTVDLYYRKATGMTCDNLVFAYLLPLSSYNWTFKATAVADVVKDFVAAVETCPDLFGEVVYTEKQLVILSPPEWATKSTISIGLYNTLCRTLSQLHNDRSAVLTSSYDLSYFKNPKVINSVYNQNDREILRLFNKNKHWDIVECHEEIFPEPIKTHWLGAHFNHQHSYMGPKAFSQFFSKDKEMVHRGEKVWPGLMAKYLPIHEKYLKSLELPSKLAV